MVLKWLINLIDKIDIRFAHWNLHKIMASQRGQSLTYELRKLNLIRNEMTVFVGQYYNFLCTFMMQSQWKKLQKDVRKLKLAGELTIDSLKKGLLISIACNY